LPDELLDLKFSYATDFDAFYAAAFPAEDSNSALGSFQKFGQEFDQRFVGTALYRGGLQPYLQGAGHCAYDFVLASAGLYSNSKNDGAGRDVFYNVQHQEATKLAGIAQVASI
jgi:hypothetical protein